MREQIEYNEYEKLQLILEGIFSQLFIPLGKTKQSCALSIFMQINHNNPHIDKLYSAYQNFLIYDDYESGDNYFTELLEIEYSLLGIKDVIKAISNYSEVSRLTAILLALHNDNIGRDKHLELATIIWGKSQHKEFRYVYSLLKTKVELLIYNKEYFEAVTLAETCYQRLIDEEINNEDTTWLKYQFCKTLIKLSENVKTLYNFNDLIVLLEEYKEVAIIEDSFRHTIQSRYNND